MSESEMTTSTPIFRNNDENAKKTQQLTHLDPDQTLILSNEVSTPRSHRSNRPTDRLRARNQQQHSNILIYDSSNHRPHLRSVLHSPNRYGSQFMENSNQVTKARFNKDRPHNHQHEETQNFSPRIRSVEEPHRHQSSRDSTSQPKNAAGNHHANDEEFRHKLRLIRSRDSMREIQNLNGDIRSKIEELRYIMHSGKIH